MTIASSERRRRASGLAFVLALAPATPGLGQGSPALEACAAIDSERDRLACYDAAAASGAEPAPDEPSEPASPTPPRPASVPTSPSGDPAESGAGSTPSADAVDARRPAAASERRSRRPADDDGDVVRITVVGVRTNISGLAVFTTRDGRTFEQTSIRTYRYPEPPFRARLEPASMGSYFLRTEGSRRRVRVSERE